MKNLFLTALTSIFVMTASAAELTPAQQYRGLANGAIFMCKLNLQNALLNAQLSNPLDEKSDYRACIATGKVTAKENFDKAMKTVKKPQAKEALKTYHVALVSAFDGIVPGTDERKINYERRQQDLDGKLTEAWARFEIEQ